MNLNMQVTIFCSFWHQTRSVPVQSLVFFCVLSATRRMLRLVRCAANEDAATLFFFLPLLTTTDRLYSLVFWPSATPSLEEPFLRWHRRRTRREGKRTLLGLPEEAEEAGTVPRQELPAARSLPRLTQASSLLALIRVWLARLEESRRPLTPVLLQERPPLTLGPPRLLTLELLRPLLTPALLPQTQRELVLLPM